MNSRNVLVSFRVAALAVFIVLCLFGSLGGFKVPEAPKAEAAVCAQIAYDASLGTSPEQQGWNLAYESSSATSATLMVDPTSNEPATKFLRLQDRSRDTGIAYRQNLPGAVADRDWTYTIKGKFEGSDFNPDSVGMLMFIASNGQRYSNIYFHSRWYGVLAPRTVMDATGYHYSRSVEKNLRGVFRTVEIINKKNGAGAADDTFNVKENGVMVFEGVRQDELYIAGPVETGSNGNELAFWGPGGGYGEGTMDVATISFKNTDCGNTGTIICSTNAQCGTNGFTNNATCTGNTIHQTYRTWTCNNPGTTSSTCTSSDVDQTTNCTGNQTCSNGTCNNNATLTASCAASPNPVNTNQTVNFTPTVSGGNGTYTYQWSGACSSFNQNCSNTFSNAGTQTAMLHVTSSNGNQSVDVSCPVVVNQTGTIACTTASQCGTNGFTNNATCTGNTVQQMFRTWTCNNPGTTSSTCTFADANQTTNCTGNQTCSNGTCNNNATLTASCTASPNPANTNQQVAFNSTVSGGTGSYSYQWSGACSGSGQTCSNTYANSGSQTATLTVTSGTQSQSTNCPVVVNQTGTIACTTNSQCGTNGLTGSATCQGNSVYQNYRTWNCINPGTTSSSCVPTDSNQLQNNCLTNQTCSNGTCVNNTNNLSVSCSANPNPANVNQQVNFNPSVSGGTGNYAYSWSGACTGSSQTCSRIFSNSGSQTANLTVTSGNQTQSANCSASIINNQNVCTSHSYQQCLGGSVHWFNSCGVDEGISQACTGNQTCSGNVCVNQNQNSLSITTLVRNLSSGNLNWATFVNASPSDVVQYQITLRNNGNQTINNITLRDTLPANLYYYDNLTIDGVANSGNIISGINIGTITPGQSRIVTYQVQVAPASNFSFGTTTLNNSINVTSTDSGFVSPGLSSASVVVTRGSVQGATNVPTGLTNNFFVDSFFIPLLLALVGAWLFWSGTIPTPAWMKKYMSKDGSIQRKLADKIAAIKSREVV